MSKKAPSPKKLSKKNARQAVYNRLVVALAEFKTGIKDKKFESNLQKASKLFADELIKAEKKVKGADKKNGKKVAKVKPAKKLEEQPAV